MFHMASQSHISSLASSLLHSSCEADLALVTESGVSMAHSALLLPLLPDLASLLADEASATDASSVRGSASVTASLSGTARTRPRGTRGV